MEQYDERSSGVSVATNKTESYEEDIFSDYCTGPVACLLRQG